MKLHLALTAVVLLLSAFATAAQEPAEYSIDRAKSKLEINVYKEGLFKAFGHDHLITSNEISGLARIDVQKIENSSVTMKIKAGSLTVVDPGESEKDRLEVQATMAGEKVLDVQRFSEILFSSKAVSVISKVPDRWELTLSGILELHGIEKPISFPVRVSASGREIGVQGEVSLLQTQFGITPVTIAGGSVKVKDKVKVGFTIVATKVDP